MRKMIDIIRTRAFLGLMYLTIFLLMQGSTAAIAQSLSKDQITASYLYNLIKNVRWPNQESVKEIKVGLYQAEDPQLLVQLQSHFSGVKVNGKPITVTRAYTKESLANFQLVYLGNIATEQLEAIYKAIEVKPVLLISSNVVDKQLVMINLISTADNRIRFEVNKANIIAQGLTVHPDIILHGGTEIDVAQLFKEGQASLIKMQQRLRERESTLQKLEEGVIKLQQDNSSLNKNLVRLRTTIEQNEKQLYAQNEQIKQQKTTLQATQAERSRLEEQLGKTAEELSNAQVMLDGIGVKISEREAALDNLNKTLLEQKSKIIELDTTIETQELMVNNLIALVLLGIILIVVAVWAYISKKRDAERLEEQRRDLKIARDTLAIAKVRAEEANLAKSEFLSLMSHELRTPLQAVIGYTDVVIEDLKLEGMDGYTKDLNRVVNNSERLLRLINGVLDLAKIESGRMELQLSPVDLKELVSDAVANIQPQFDEKNLSLNFHSDNGKDLPVADGEKLLHIILNLLSNSCKFTDSGLVKLIVENRGNHLYISVQDTGAGISAEQLPYVFDRFRQADSSTTRRHQGSGLGLAITKQFCELMGGEIEAHSEQNMGTTFTIHIPLPISPVAPKKSEIPVESTKIDHQLNEQLPSNEGNRNINILMVDDDTEYLSIMSRTLRKAQYTVYTAINADEGLSLAKELIPDLITMDLLLPDMHGWELFKSIKENKELCNIPIIVASVIDDRQRSKQFGADDFLTKPVARTALKLAVERLTSEIETTA